MKSSDIRIREAKPIDFPKIVEMHYPVWRQSWSGMLAAHLLDMLAQPQRWASEFYPQTLNRRGWSMWIAESGGRTLGMTMFGPDPAQPDRIQIDALYIAEESQRHGIGGRLLNKVLRSYPSDDVVLWCAEKNAKARRFYEKKNFEVDGRTFAWKPLPGVSVPHVGYRLKRR
ncbi:GNAT family N-acetyltransferase [Mycobacterium lacus]|uniref:N-acetyltransferase n=1 Tax=Mycobacterium lacus TaxID=169765 RepID=A0A1X1YL09_9MYCO|nr:GNAT family N-acetyltransferase [Mycobacterium lacus]ORW11742.1 GNAT family acetyltransferase [Mycobacterium lacus]BBX97412.1 N-acetyltransferase [Mycobacterium lacus]